MSTIEPFYFDSENQPLYACFHPAKRKKRKAIGVIFCYPLGRDYFRLHRVYRQFASRLAKQGMDCLRFDYFGTGDSPGSSEEIRLDSCQQNVRDALTVLIKKAAPRRVYCIGHWLGASIALLATSDSNEVSGLVLCDPVLDGQEYLGQIRAPTANKRRLETKDAAEVQGFLYSTTALRQITRIHRDAFKRQSRQRTILITSNADCYQRKPGEVDGFVAQVRSLGQVCQHEHLTLDLSQTQGDYDLLDSLPVGGLYASLSSYLN